MTTNRWFMLLVAVFAFSGCSMTDEDDAAGTSLPDDVQFLSLRDDAGNLYQLPYQAALTPAQLARQVTLSARDESDDEIPLLHVGKGETDIGEIPEVAAITVWPLRKVQSDDEDTSKVYLNGISGVTACWTGQSIGSPGGARWYYVNSAFATDGFIDASNTTVDFDLYQYINGSLICTSVAGSNYVDSCASYNRLAGNQSWQYKVRRFNSAAGTYRFCTNYWSSY